MPTTLIGKLLIDSKVISKAGLDQALEMQVLHPDQPIGQILCQMGLLSRDDLDSVIEHNNKRRKLGEILVHQKLIDREKLKYALMISKEENIPLGKALIKQHILDEEKVARAIALQRNLKYVSLANKRFDTSLSDLINAIAERRRPQDSSFKMNVSKDNKIRSVDFRVSTVPTQFGENVVIRILDKRSGPISLEQIGFSPEAVSALYNALDKPTGIFLVTGPTGSGKSTTLYAILAHINTPVVKTLTIEDPIEYSIEGITQTEVNEVIGNTFASLLRSFLRQDPDNIMVGEIRDLDTASISMRAALTGHTVLSTLHTNDATSAVTRLMDMGVEPSLISTTLRCAMAQRLIRKICSNCATPYAPPNNLLTEFGVPLDNNMIFFKGAGCQHCNYTGFNGRKPIVELWIPTREELLMINRRPDNITLRDAVFAQVGRLTMIEDGFRFVQAGETTLDELLRVVPYEQIEAGRNKISQLFK